MAYSVDPSKLASSNNPDDLKVVRYGQTLGLNKILFSYTDSTTRSIALERFKDTNNTPSSSDDLYINGTVHSSASSWEVVDDVVNRFVPSGISAPQFVERGSYVSFKRVIAEQSTGNYVLYIDSSNKLVFENQDTGSVINSWGVTNFDDGRLPGRAIVFLSSGGGGGGFSAGTSDQNGTGGGAGGFFCVVLDLTKLYKGDKYYFTVGDAGTGGWANYSGTSGWMLFEASSGGNSALYFNQTLLLSIDGGGAGTSRNSSGSGGGGGTVRAGDGTNMSYLNNTNTPYLNDYFWWLGYGNGRSFEHGFGGGSAGASPASTPTYTLTNNSSTSSSTNSTTIGGYSSGGCDSRGGGGGAASWLGSGGSGGGYGSSTNGKDGSGYSSGGGGATWTVFTFTGGGSGKPGYLHIFVGN